jgi:hypothetical protein
MGEDASYSIIRAFPIHFIILSLVGGLFFLYLTPLILFLPSWMLNPFSAASPSDAISTAISVILAAFLVGFPCYYLRLPLIATGGLNDKFSPIKLLRKKSLKSDKFFSELGKPRKQLKPVENIDVPLFARWLDLPQNKGYARLLTSISAECALIEGLLIGAELSVIFSAFIVLIVSPLLWLFGFPFLLDKILGSLLMVISNIVLAALLFTLVLLYVKLYWNPLNDDRQELFHVEFSEYKAKLKPQAIPTNQQSSQSLSLTDQ